MVHLRPVRIKRGTIIEVHIPQIEKQVDGARPIILLKNDVFGYLQIAIVSANDSEHFIKDEILFLIDVADDLRG